MIYHLNQKSAICIIAIIINWRYLLRVQCNLAKKFRHKTANLQCEAYTYSKHSTFRLLFIYEIIFSSSQDTHSLLINIF